MWVLSAVGQGLCYNVSGFKCGKGGLKFFHGWPKDSGRFGCNPVKNPLLLVIDTF